MKNELKSHYIKTIPAIKEELGIKNVMAVPKITKVVVSTGTGRNRDKKRAALIVDRLAKITGQKPASRGAKKSIASFKLREGEIIGYQITLRGARMWSFLSKLINVAIPRTRDFRGLETKGVDEMGNFTMGVKEHIVFPESADEDIKDVFGIAVTVVTTAKDKKSAESLLRAVGFPFKK
ncbi:MAG: 50S ribosomal protein L5 [Patescibacteria group bacterium]